MTLIHEAEESSREVWVVQQSVSVPQLCFHFFFFLFFSSERKTNRQKEMKNNPLKKSLITSQSPWFRLMSCLFLLGGSVMRKTALPATVKLDTQPNKIANKIYFLKKRHYAGVFRQHLCVKLKLSKTAFQLDTYICAHLHFKRRHFWDPFRVIKVEAYTSPYNEY